METIKQFGKDGWTPARMEAQAGKTYIITGANAGTGFEAARILLSKGAQVIMLNRSVERSAKAADALKAVVGAKAKVSFIQMDLAEAASVREAADKILKTVPRIDALICNAAIAQVAKQEFTPDGHESQLGVNHYGHFILCNLLFDRIEESEGRIVTVCSMGYKMGLKTIQFDDMNMDHNYEANRAYSQSKLAQMMFTYELERRAREAGKKTKMYVCHPGSSKTSLIDDKASWATRITFGIMKLFPIVQTAEQGAYPELCCATEPNLKTMEFYGPNGTMQWVGRVEASPLDKFALDRGIASRLWDVSEEVTGCKWEL